MKHRTNILTAALLLTGLFVALIAPLMKTSAAGLAPYYLTLTASSTSADAGGSKITLSVYAYSLKCADLTIVLQGEACGDGSTPQQSPAIYKKLSVTASDVNLEGVQSESGAFYIKTGEDGKVQFTASSTGAGTRQVTVSSDYPPVNGAQSVSLTFKSVAVASPAPKPKAPAPAPAPAPVPEPPKAPEVASMQIAGQDVADKNNISVEGGKPFELKGKTVANGVVKLYIFSTPREATVTADADGNWAYTIKGLEPGSHHVEAEVTDPATQKTSARGNLVAFTVQEAKKTTPIAAMPTKKTSKAWLLWVIASIVLAAVAGIWWVRRRKQKMPTTTTNTMVNPSEPSSTSSSSSPTFPDGLPDQETTKDPSEKQQ